MVQYHSKHARYCRIPRLSLATATFLVAIFGIVHNLQAARILSSIQPSLPQIHLARLHPLSPLSTHSVADIHMPSSMPAITAANSSAATVVAAAEPTGDPKADLHSWRLFSVLSVGQQRHSDAGGIGGAAQEQARWDTLRVLIRILQLYLLISIGCCVAGAIGVVKSHLYLSRIFVVHAGLDLFFCVLSFLSLALLCSLPSLRTHVCEQLASGELGRWSSSPATPSSPWPLTTRGPSYSRSARPPAVAPTQTNPHSLEAFLDFVLGSEDCDESFSTIVVPVFLLLGLAYTALRVRFFLTIHHFYKGLLRERTLEYTYGHSYAPPMRHAPSPKRTTS